MSDKPAAEKKPAAADDKKGGDKKPAAAKKGKLPPLLTKTPVLIGAVMALEAVGLFAGFKVLGGGPKAATAQIAMDTDSAPTEEGHGDADHAAAKPEGEAKGEHGEGAKPTPKRAKGAPVEVAVCDVRAPNRRSGRTILYDVSIYAVARAEQADKLKDAFSTRDALIKDRVRTIIAELDPDLLNGGAEPGLETLRRQVKFQLSQIAGDGVVQQVLVPRCMPFRTDY